jgi:hypothetical protein
MNIKITKDKRKRLSQEDVDAAILMYRGGHGCKAIAKKIIGRESAKSTIRGILIRAGVFEERDPHEARRNSPVKRGELKRSESEIAIRNELKRRQDNKKGTRAIAELPLFKAANKAKDRDARKFKDIAAQSRGYKSVFHERYQTDPAFKAVVIHKSRFHKIALGQGHGSSRMMALIGCSPDELRQWIESQWEDWMTWDNIGGIKDGNWQIDHIVPCSWFDHENDEDLAICWHYMNIRPLCSLANVGRLNSVDRFGDDAIEALMMLPESKARDGLISKAKQMGVHA